MEPHHAVESPTGTFIVSHYNDQLNQHQVSEVNTGGKVPHQFSGSRLASLGLPDHVAVDSHGNIFVADRFNCHILLLNAQLKLRRVIVDEHRLNYHEPWRLCYVERTGQLLDHVAVDSHGNIFVADRFNCHILLLNAQLKLRRPIVDEHQLNDEMPWSLCYVERTGQLFVGLERGVEVFDVLRR